MTKYYFIIATSIIISLFSCKSADDNNLKTYYDNGKIKIKSVKIDEDKYLIKEFYENGKLKSITERNKEGIEHGNFKLYYPNGLLEQEAIKLNGKLDGVIKNYYENGNLERSMNIKKGNPYGCCDYMYRKDGSLRRAGLYTFAGDLIFIARFNKDDNIEKVEGRNLTILVNKSNLKVGEKIRIELDRYVVPNIKRKAFLNIKRNGKLIEQIPFESNVLSMPFNYSGKYTLEVKSIFEDAESISKSIIDSLNTTLQVEVFAKEDKI